MTVYPIVEAELNTITVMNVFSTVAFSIGSLFLGFAANIWINAAFYKDMPPEARVMVTYGAPLCTALCLIFFAGGIVAIVMRGAAWRRVRRSTIPESTTRSRY
jgi:hypothetical protein